MRILSGKEKGPKRDLVLANASAAFYVLGEVDDFESGTTLAREILESGLAAEKLDSLVRKLGDVTLLEKWLRRAS